MLRLSRTPLLLALILGLFTSAVAFAQKKDEVVIGYVNLQRAILEVEEGKRAKAQLKVTFEKKQAELQKREAELMKLKEALEREASAASDAANRQKVIEFQNKMMELQKVFMEEQKGLAELEQGALSGITTKMRGVIDEIGKAGGYTLILEVQDSRLLYAKTHLDLTNEVIRKYNQKFK